MSGKKILAGLFAALSHAQKQAALRLRGSHDIGEAEWQREYKATPELRAAYELYKERVQQDDAERAGEARQIARANEVKEKRK